MNDDHFVSWLHVGDLHASDEDGWESVDTLSRIVDTVREHVPAGALDFAFLPGDNANHGEPEQYERVARELVRLDLPRYVIPGDHDFEPGSLERFNASLGTAPLPAVVRYAGRRALFLDIVSAGTGGPDFRLGDEQTDWLRDQLRQSKVHREPRPLVFMHAFPADLHRDGREIGRLFAEAGVAFVDTGHTHYNELLNDGAVIYSATRSTGQIEEGPAGFAIAAVDGDVASWGFKELAAPWPWVLITSPADARMTVAANAIDVDGPGIAPLVVNALVLGADVARVEVRADDGGPVAMQPLGERAGRWTATLPARTTLPGWIVVTARSADGVIGEDRIRLRRAGDELATGPAGDHAATIGTWNEHGVLGSRLGPNANGKDW